jgi:hypothetical protein
MVKILITITPTLTHTIFQFYIFKYSSTVISMFQ